MFVPHPTVEDFPAIMGQIAESTAEKSGPRGLGDMVAAGLDAIGLTKARAQAVASAFGFSDCGCDARQEALNLAFPFAAVPPENPPPATIDQSGEAAGPR
jgi:hypothetical protein